jgi:hypothetical protein
MYPIKPFLFFLRQNKTHSIKLDLFFTFKKLGYEKDCKCIALIGYGG